MFATFAVLADDASSLRRQTLCVLLLFDDRVVSTDNTDVVEAGVDGDVEDCWGDDANASLNFLRCLLLCLSCSRFAIASRRTTS